MMALFPEKSFFSAAEHLNLIFSITKCQILWKFIVMFLFKCTVAKENKLVSRVFSCCKYTVLIDLFQSNTWKASEIQSLLA